MGRIFAIGDIHGCNKTFEKLLFEKINIQKDDQVYCLGDFIDRGKNSKDVIDLILHLREEEYSIFTLRGNHEQMLLDSLFDVAFYETWIDNGGENTLRSFGIASVRDMDKKYLAFFKETLFYIETEKFIFAHAGLNFDRKNLFEDKEAMIWERGFDDYQLALGNKILIHGHTPKSLSHILHQKGNCINIDGGCVYLHKFSFGNLVAIELNEHQFYWQENIE